MRWISACLAIALALCGCSTVTFEQPEAAEIARPDCDLLPGWREATLVPFRTRVARGDEPVEDTGLQWTSSHPEVWLLDQNRIEAVAYPDDDVWGEVGWQEDIYAQFSGTVTLVEDILPEGFDLGTDHQGGLQAWLWVDVDSLCDGPDPFPEAVWVEVSLDGASATQRLVYR
jgi:hypothetical protein